MKETRKKNSLIAHTGSYKKVVINMDMARELADENLMKQLNHVLIELNHIQETIIDKRE